MGQYCQACDCPCDEHPVHTHDLEDEDEVTERRAERRTARRKRPWHIDKDDE